MTRGSDPARAETKRRALGDEAFRLLVESIKDYAIFMLDPGGHVASWNAGAQRIKGYEPGEILGEHFSRFYPAEDVTSGKPRMELERARAEGRFEDEGWRVRKDGSLFWANAVIAAVRDDSGALLGFAKVTRDLSEQRAALEALRLSESRLGATLRSIGDGVIATDAAGRVEWMNPVAAHLTGWQTDEARGLAIEKVFCIVNEDTRAVVESPVTRVLREGIVVGLANHTALLARDGTERAIADSGAPIRVDGGPVQGVVLVFRDVTEERATRLHAEQTERELIREQAGRAAAEAAEKSIRESEARYRESSEQLAIILQGVVEGIVVHGKDGKVVFANDAAGRSWGYGSGAELVAAKAEDVRASFLLTDEQDRVVPLEDLPPRRVLRGEAPPPMMLRVRNRATGGEWWALVVASAVRTPDGDGEPYLAVSIWHDMTERRRAEASARYLADATAALSSSLDYETTLRQLARLAVPDLADWCGVDLVQPDGTLKQLAVAHVDPAKVEMARELNRKYPPDPTEPTGTPNVVRTGKPELYPDIPDAMLVAGTRDQEHLRLARELGLRSAMVVPLVAGDRPVGAMSFVSAESQRRYGAADLALALEIGRRAGLAIDNARLYREAQEAVRARDEFLSVASHELRTPCTSLQLQLQSLQRTLDRRPQEALASGRIAQSVKVALEQTARFNRLIEELLDVSRIAADRLKLELLPNDLVAILSDVVKRFEPALEDAGCVVEFRHPAALIGSWDRLRLEQVASNLLSNAIKYGPRKPIEIDVEAIDGMARITVRDHGIGIPPEDQARVFEPFERAVSSRHYGGFGLGLWITREIIEAHGGAIRLDSAPGRGSTFVVELPQSAPAPGSQP